MSSPFGDLPEPDFAWFDDARLAADRGAAALGAYEDRAVREACRLLGQPRLAAAVAAEARARTGAAGCRFALFEELTGFPLRLRCGRGSVRWLSAVDLFDRFARLPLVAGLEAVAAGLDPAEGPYGLVFRWAGSRDDEGRHRRISGGQYMALHTDDRPVAAGAVRVSAVVPIEGEPTLVHLETLRAALAAYAGWRPPS